MRGLWRPPRPRLIPSQELLTHWPDLGEGRPFYSQEGSGKLYSLKSIASETMQ